MITFQVQNTLHKQQSQIINDTFNRKFIVNPEVILYDPFL